MNNLNIILLVLTIYGGLDAATFFNVIDEEEKTEIEGSINKAGDEIRMIHRMETDDCHVTIIENGRGERGLVKQIKDPSADEQFLLVIDAFACSLASACQAPMNKVSLISPDVAFPGKYFPNRLATFHSLAPGLATSERLPWPGFDIHQRLRKPHSRQWREWGPLPLKESGLTLNVIHQMSLHPSLPIIVAFDTFIGNADRSLPNLFYDADKRSFCGIDLAASFNSELAECALLQLSDLFSNKETALSEEELNGLRLYQQTLSRLTRSYSIGQLNELFDEFAKQGGFEPHRPAFTQDAQDRLRHHKRIMEANYTFSLKILESLNRFLGAISDP